MEKSKVENLRFSGKDKVPVVAEINTLDEFKRFVLVIVINLMKKPQMNSNKFP